MTNIRRLLKELKDWGWRLMNSLAAVRVDRARLIGIYNDSKKEFGSRRDRHEHIGQGYIGLEGFRNIMNDERLAHIPKVLETPKGKEQLEDLENIKILKSLIK